MIIPKIKCKWVFSHEVKRSELPKINTPGEAVQIFRQLFDENELQLREHFYALYLNTAARVIGYELISVGGIDQAPVDVRMVAAPALGVMASSVVLCHNHPSGANVPSDADKIITKRLRDGLLLLGIKLIDHIILTEDSSYSFANEGAI